MMGQVEIIQNDPRVPVGVFGALLQKWRVSWRISRPYAGEALPATADAVVVLGGVMGVHDESAHPFLRPLKGFIRQMLDAGTPLLGVCLGGQLLADVAGGTVSGNCRGEQGLVDIRLTAAGTADPLFAGIDSRFQAFQWHHDSFSLPPGAQHLATSLRCPGQAFRIGNAWGIQFHPEVDPAIVADWSARNDPAGTIMAAFAAAETTHVKLAEGLLRNFIDVAAGSK